MYSLQVCARYSFRIKIMQPTIVSFWIRTGHYTCWTRHLNLPFDFPGSCAQKRRRLALNPSSTDPAFSNGLLFHSELACLPALIFVSVEMINRESILADSMVTPSRQAPIGKLHRGHEHNPAVLIFGLWPAVEILDERNGRLSPYVGPPEP
jgi:hypothetical protein